MEEDKMKNISGRDEIGSYRNEKGFTLIEMAIVLVIIGIIIGAVLKGQDMVAEQFILTLLQS